MYHPSTYSLPLQSILSCGLSNLHFVPLKQHIQYARSLVRNRKTIPASFASANRTQRNFALGAPVPCAMLDTIHHTAVSVYCTIISIIDLVNIIERHAFTGEFKEPTDP